MRLAPTWLGVIVGVSECWSGLGGVVSRLIGASVAVSRLICDSPRRCLGPSVPDLSMFGSSVLGSSVFGSSVLGSPVTCLIGDSARR